VSSKYNEVLRRKASRQMSIARIIAQINGDIEREEWGTLTFRANELSSVAKSLETDDIWLADHMDDGKGQ